MSSVDLGPRRQVLESFYYGAHYMLGSFSRPGTRALYSTRSRALSLFIDSFRNFVPWDI